MKVTIDGITYEGTVDEIREIVSNPPTRSINRTNTQHVDFQKSDWDDMHRRLQDWPNDFQKNWDGSPKVTCYARN